MPRLSGGRRTATGKEMVDQPEREMERWRDGELASWRATQTANSDKQPDDKPASHKAPHPDNKPFIQSQLHNQPDTQPAIQSHLQTIDLYKAVSTYTSVFTSQRTSFNGPKIIFFGLVFMFLLYKLKMPDADEYRGFKVTLC